MPTSEARISPMDRGFLFGDGIYEVIPSYQGKLVGFTPHIDRMQRGLAEIGIQFDWNHASWLDMIKELLARNGNGDLGVYLHVSRGTDSKRGHAFPAGVTPTVFAFTFAINPPPTGLPGSAKPIQVASASDLRWKRCHIKSTALLGNVLHHQQGVDAGYQETILFNEQEELTEGSSCNAFIVKDGLISTPPLDQQILPGITRLLLLQILRTYSTLPVQERVISKAEVLAADEVWLTSSSKELMPVVAIDGQPVGSGEVGAIWYQAQQLFAAHKFTDYPAAES
ncbi:D-amino acid aminotransferase [Rheinheimera sp.]|uniref:D-amino acid aminotransferase n=1 Tax=Rheinheimera sp. TaxID=1869214 RepID=UPI003D286A71